MMKILKMKIMNETLKFPNTLGINVTENKI